MQHFQDIFSRRPANLLSLPVLVVLVALMLQAGISHAADEYHYPTGLTEPSEAEKAWMEKNVIKADPKTILSQSTAQALPSRVVNIEFLPKVGRQVWGACAAWASTYYYKTWQEAKEHGWHRPDPTVDPEHIMSPAFTFNLYNGGHDLSSSPPALSEASAEAPLPQASIPASFGYLTIYGAAPISKMDENTHPGIMPNAEQFYAAFPSRAQDVYELDYTTTTGMEALKTHLASGDLAAISLILYQNFTSYPADGEGRDNEVFFANEGTPYDYWCDHPPCTAAHALTVIGYDDNKTYIGADGLQHSGAMLLVNSWGTGWGAYLPEAGEAGFIWIGYDYFQTQTAGIANYMTDRINYQPTLVGSFGVKHERRGELGISLLAGDKDNPDWQMDVLPIAGGPTPINTTIGFDATDYANGNEMNFWLTVQDQDLPGLWSPPKTGTITSFEVKLPNGHVWKSPDAPVDTVDFDFSNPAETTTQLNISLLYKEADILADAHAFNTSHVWADLDNDGNFDLLFFDTPWDYRDAKCRIFRKDRTSSMQERSCSIPYLSQGDIAVADVNGDGLADVAVNGYLNDQATTKIYFNSGNFQFVDSGIQLPDSYGPMEWIDYNNDGRPDLSLMLASSDYMRPVKLLLQNVNGGFSPANLGLPATRNFAWADYNRDGRLDVALPVSGGYALYYQNSTGLAQTGPVLGQFGEVLAWGDADNDGWLDLALTYPDTIEIWRNNGNGTFSLYTSISGASPSVGGMSWGDINNDGLNDLAIWGDFGSPQGMYWNIRPQILLNDGNGNFHNGGFNFIGVTALANTTADLLQWIDYDNDGDLDISIAGIGPQPEGLPRRFALYINHAADTDGLGAVNTPPTAPALLEATQAQTDGPVRLSWSSGNDAQTNPAGLFYNVRIGRNPTTADILSPDAVAHLDGATLHPTLSSSPGLTLESPPAPAFYWSVQSVDGSHARSPWSPPQLFSATPGLIPGDLNNDSIIDVADVLKTARMANGSEPVNTAVADRNGDNKVDQKDVLLMENTILGETGAGNDIIATTYIGPTGGTLSGDGFTLEVPEGAFDETTKLTLHNTEIDKPFGSNGRSPLFRLKGLPATRNKPLTLRILSNAPISEDAYIALGQYASAFDAPVIERRFSAMPATDLGNGQYEITILATDGVAASQPAAALKNAGIEKMKTLDSSLDDMRDDLVDADIILVVGYFSNAYQSTHFNIMESGVTLKYTDAIHLAQSFEHAYEVLTSAPYHFKCQFNSSGKVDIYVKRMASGTYGLQQSSALGKLNNYIEVNFDKLADKTAIEQTAVHEFFHYIQDLYDPQSMRSKFYLGSRYLWLEEASSVWSEELAVNNDIPASVFTTHVWNSLANGLHTGALGTRKNRQYAGYGSAGLIKYISMLPNGARRIRNIFEDISLNKDSITAVLDYMQPARQNWSNYVTNLVTGKLYDIRFGSELFVDNPEKLSISDASGLRKSKIIFKNFPALSAKGFRLDMNTAAQTLLTDRHMLSAELRLDKEHADDLQMLLIKIRRKGSSRSIEGEVIGEATKANDSLKFDIPNIKQLYADGWKVYPLVINRSMEEPYDQSLHAGLTMAVTSDEEKTLEAMDVPGHQAYRGVPMLHVAGSMKAGGWSDYEMKDFLIDPAMTLPYLRLKVPGVTPLPMELSYQASITNGLKIDSPDSDGYYSTWSVSGLNGYELNLSKNTEEDTIQEYLTIPSNEGNFLFDIPDDARYLSGLIEVSYTVVEQRYHRVGENDDPVGSPIYHSGSSAILLFVMEL